MKDNHLVQLFIEKNAVMYINLKHTFYQNEAILLH